MEVDNPPLEKGGFHKSCSLEGIEPSKLEYAKVSHHDELCEDDFMGSSDRLYNAWLPKDIPVRETIYAILSDPNCCRLAQWYSRVMITIVLISVTSLCFQTIPTWHLIPNQVWNFIDLFSTLFLTLEYVLRFLTCPNHKYFKFFIRFPNLVDLLSVIPFYVDAFLQISDIEGYGIIRIFRFGRIVRLMVRLRKSKQLRLVLEALRRSVDGIVLLILCFGLGVITFSSLEYYFETTLCAQDEFHVWRYITEDDSRGQVCDFQSIPGAFWWATVTMTTVGYGDIVPKTIPGKLVAMMTMLSALMLLSFPITIISANLSQVYQERRDFLLDYQRRAEMKYIKDLSPELATYEEIIEGLLEREKLLTTELRAVKDQLVKLNNLQEELSTYIQALKTLRENEHL